MPPLDLYARVHFLSANRTRDLGCSVHLVFPASSDFEGVKSKMQTSGDKRREIATPYPPSLRAKRSNPFRRTKKEWIASSQGLLAMTDVRAGPGRSRRPAQAGHCVDSRNVIL